MPATALSGPVWKPPPFKGPLAKYPTMHRVSVPLLASLVFYPGTVSAQDVPRPVTGEPTTLGEFAVVFGVYALFTLVVGAILLAISTSSVRAIEGRLVADPLNAGAIGLGVLVGGFVALVVASAVTATLVGVGAPAIVGRAPIALTVALSAGLTVANTIGIITAGSVLLRRVGLSDDAHPNPWLALVVGTITVQLLYLVPLVNLVVALVVVGLATGATVEYWWTDRDENGGEGEDEGPSDPEPREDALDR